MIDQNSQFFAILTAVGEAKQANATALGQPWAFSQMGVGDANGTDPIPNRTQTRLINEWRRAAVNQVRTDPANPNIIITEQVIPADVGGEWIRELALYDADGDMVAVANCAPSYKPLMAQGTGKTQIIRMNFIVSNAASIVLKIDPAVVTATREYVDTQIIEALAKLDFKHSVLVATTGNIVLSGVQTIDGVLLPADARVLVKNQALAKDNGLYVVSAGPWARAKDADSGATLNAGVLVPVEAGAVNADTLWMLKTDGTIIVGATAITFQWAGGLNAPTQAAGDNSTKVANTAFVHSAITALVASSPATLDTLNELAAALGNDANFAATITAALALKAPLASPALTGNPTAPTSAQFDNDTSIATTAFVKQSGWTSSGITAFNASASIPATAIGGSVEYYGGTAGTLTVPLSSASGRAIAADRLEIFNFSTAICTVVPQGGDNLLARNTIFNALRLQPGDSVVLLSGAGLWFIVGGSAVNQVSQSFGSAMATNGYKKWPDANSPSGVFIEQWGNLTSNPSGLATVIFPVAFPNACLGIPGLVAAVNGVSQYSLAAGTPSQTGVNIYAGISYSAGVGAPVNITWRAIGY